MINYVKFVVELVTWLPCYQFWKANNNMPKWLEDKILKSVKKAHPEYSNARAKDEMYRIMNKEHLLNRKKKKKSSVLHSRKVRHTR